MRVTLVRPGELGPEEARLWTEFQRITPVTLNPYLSLTFAQAIDQFRPNSRVAVIEVEGKIQAFLPLEITSHRIGVPIGSPMNDLQGFVGSTAAIDARIVIRKSGLRGWRFLHVPVEQHALKPHYYKETVVKCPVIDLSEGYQSYYQSVAASATWKAAQKRRRRIERQFGPVSLVWSTTNQAHFDQLIDWKRSKYGGADLLFSDSTALRIIEKLAAADAEDCRGIVSVMFAGKQPIANLLGLIGPTALSVAFSSYDPDWAHFSPGTIMWYLLAEQAARRRITRIDFGGGQDNYKFSLTNQFYLVAGGAVWVSRVEDASRRLYRRLLYNPSRRIAESKKRVTKDVPRGQLV